MKQSKKNQFFNLFKEINFKMCIQPPKVDHTVIRRRDMLSL